MCPVCGKPLGDDSKYIFVIDRKIGWPRSVLVCAECDQKWLDSFKKGGGA